MYKVNIYDLEGELIFDGLGSFESILNTNTSKYRVEFQTEDEREAYEEFYSICFN